MPIYAPGIRDRNNRPRRSRGRNAVAMLSLTAMVDMFTVLVTFLLMNFNVTGQAIELDDAVELPKATETKELKPANVVVVSKQSITLNREIVAKFDDVKEQQDWMINTLHNRLQDSFNAKAEERRLLGLDQVKEAVDQAKMGDQNSRPIDDRNVTIQADKNVDFLTIKKVMYTVKEAGAGQINFAVLKVPARDTEAPANQ